MLVNIISAYISDDNYVIAICVGESYRFSHRLRTSKNEELLKAVINAGRIENERWIKI